MIRTKHLVVAAAFAFITVSTAGIGTLAAKNAGSAFGQSASVILGTPAEEYPATVAEGETSDTDSFADRIRDSYVPRNMSRDTRVDDAAPADTVIDTPLPEPAESVMPSMSTTTIESEKVETDTVIPPESASSTSASTAS
jgi:hypothetical protein